MILMILILKTYKSWCWELSFFIFSGNMKTTEEFMTWENLLFNPFRIASLSFYSVAFDLTYVLGNCDRSTIEYSSKRTHSALTCMRILSDKRQLSYRLLKGRENSRLAKILHNRNADQFEQFFAILGRFTQFRFKSRNWITRADLICIPLDK